MAMVDLKTREGTVPGYLAIPKKGRGPGVLVLHAWWGLNDFFKGHCDELARAGFVAVVPRYRSGANATKPALASSSQWPLKKSFRPHHAWRTRTPGPRPFFGIAKYPGTVPSGL